jgi:CheY-like chemotaxis protein
MDSARPPRLRILVVDDSRDAADSLALLLRLWGFEPAVAYDGPSALALARAEAPAAALLDIAMPRMDGCEVARQLRKLPGPKRAFIIALTGHGGEDVVRRCYEAGIDLHFIKPYDMVELWRALHTALTGPVR